MQVTCNSFQPGSASPCTRTITRARTARPICSRKFAGILAKFARKSARNLPKNRQCQQASGRAEFFKNSDPWRTSYSCPGVTCERITRIMRTGGAGVRAHRLIFIIIHHYPPAIFCIRDPRPSPRPTPTTATPAHWCSMALKAPKCSQKLPASTIYRRR